MRLFDHIPRDSRGPAFERVRDVLEAWFARYPIPFQSALRSRIRSPRDGFCPAFFELFLHELLVRLGCCVEIHPDLQGTARRPDFLVNSPKGKSCYMEAVIVRDKGKQDTTLRVGAATLIDDERLRQAIHQKAKRYSNLDRPYVIAINDLRGKVPPSDSIGIMNALFGTLQARLDIELGTSELVRKRDGELRTGDGSEHKRVSAVLLTTWLSYSSVPRAPIRLWHNPYASKPYECELTCLPQAIPRDDGQKEFSEGKSLAEIFDLPLGWPDE